MTKNTKNTNNILGHSIRVINLLKTAHISPGGVRYNGNWLSQCINKIVLWLEYEIPTHMGGKCSISVRHYDLIITFSDGIKERKKKNIRQFYSPLSKVWVDKSFISNQIDNLIEECLNNNFIIKKQNLHINQNEYGYKLNYTDVQMPSITSQIDTLLKQYVIKQQKNKRQYTLVIYDRIDHIKKRYMFKVLYVYENVITKKKTKIGDIITNYNVQHYKYITSIIDKESKPKLYTLGYCGSYGINDNYITEDFDEIKKYINKRQTNFTILPASNKHIINYVENIIIIPTILFNYNTNLVDFINLHSIDICVVCGELCVIKYNYYGVCRRVCIPCINKNLSYKIEEFHPNMTIECPCGETHDNQIPDIKISPDFVVHLRPYLRRILRIDIICKMNETLYTLTNNMASNAKEGLRDKLFQELLEMRTSMDKDTLTLSIPERIQILVRWGYDYLIDTEGPPKEDILFEQEKAENRLNLCPNFVCNRIIQKEGGCNAVICSYCSTSFCIKCGSQYVAQGCRCNGNRINRRFFDDLPGQNPNIFRVLAIADS